MSSASTPKNNKVTNFNDVQIEISQSDYKPPGHDNASQLRL